MIWSPPPRELLTEARDAVRGTAGKPWPAWVRGALDRLRADVNAELGKVSWVYVGGGGDGSGGGDGQQLARFVGVQPAPRDEKNEVCGCSTIKELVLYRCSAEGSDLAVAQVGRGGGGVKKI